MKTGLRIFAALCVIFIAFYFFTISSFGDDQPYDSFVIYKNSDAHFIMKIPSIAVEKNVTNNRVVWEYLPVDSDLNMEDPAASSSATPITIRVNYVFIGVAIDFDEYIRILQKVKTDEGFDVNSVSVKNGRGFTYRNIKKSVSDEVGSIYLVAVSDDGWVCTVTILGKMLLLKKESQTTNNILESFEFLSSHKK